MKFYKILCVLCLIFSCGFLTACSSVNVGIYIYNNGSLMQAYEIYLDKSELEREGIDAQALQNKVDQMLLAKKQSIETTKDLTNITLNFEIKNDTRIFTIKFASIDDYIRFYEIDTSTPTPTVVEESLFYNKKIIRDDSSAYKTINTTETYAEIYDFLLNNYFVGKEEEMQKLAKNISTCTTYVYPSSLRTKSNATFHQQTGNYDVHIWETNLENELLGKSPNVKVWQTSYTINNRIAWYVTAIIISLVFGTILFLVLFLKRNKKPQQLTTTQEPTQE